LDSTQELWVTASSEITLQPFQQPLLCQTLKPSLLVQETEVNLPLVTGYQLTEMIDKVTLPALDKLSSIKSQPGIVSTQTHKFPLKKKINGFSKI
jgi:hypothetical protein